MSERTAASIAAELNTAKQRVPEIEARIADLEAKRPDAERTGADASLKLDKELQRARAELNSARRRVDDLEGEAAMASALEAEARRGKQYDNAETKLHRAIELASKAFAQCDPIIQAAVTALRQATADCAAVNADLPANRPSLALPADDDRMIAGEIYENAGLAVVRTIIDWKDARFWARIEPLPLVAHKPGSASAPKTHVTPPIEARDIKPGAGGAAIVATMPRADGAAAADESLAPLNTYRDRPRIAN